MSKFLILALCAILFGCGQQTSADMAYHAELKKETEVHIPKKQLDDYDAYRAYLCIDGYVYLSVGHGIAPYIEPSGNAVGGAFVTCERFREENML